MEQYTEDTSGIIYMEKQLENQRMTLIFHAQKGNVELPGLEGRKNLVSGQSFSGSLGDYESAVFVE